MVVLLHWLFRALRLVAYFAAIAIPLSCVVVEKIRVSDALITISAIAFLVLTRRINLRFVGIRNDALARIAETTPESRYFDQGQVSFLVTAIDSETGPDWEIWMQGTHEGNHRLVLEGSTSPSVTEQYVAGPSLKAVLESVDDELVSFLIRRQVIPSAKGKTLSYDVYAETETINRGRRLRRSRGTPTYEAAVFDRESALAWLLLGTWGVLWAKLRPGRRACRMRICFPGHSSV